MVEDEPAGENISEKFYTIRYYAERGFHCVSGAPFLKYDRDRVPYITE